MTTLAFQIKDVFTPAQIPGYGVSAGIGNLASDIIFILTSVAFILSIFFIILGGIKMVTASGDPKKLAAAGEAIKYAIIGLAVTILAFVIIQIIQFFLKSNIPIVQ